MAHEHIQRLKQREADRAAERDRAIEALMNPAAVKLAGDIAKAVREAGGDDEDAVVAIRRTLFGEPSLGSAFKAALDNPQAALGAGYAISEQEEDGVVKSVVRETTAGYGANLDLVADMFKGGSESRVDRDARLNAIKEQNRADRRDPSGEIRKAQEARRQREERRKGATQ